MKIEEAKSTATLVGDIQTNAVSIDINNIGFITQLLSTNLYSKPIDSFLREIVSNAWDSHVEAGNNEPILLEIGTDTEGKNYCRIQDFGVGLSPQRFNEIYKNIGSSTKRADNTQIGGFGVGRFSALAYSGTVYLTSNYEGVKYKYLMYKDGNLIKIDELFNAPTKDRDGLEVMVYLKPGDYPEFKRAIKNQLVYFENLYISIERYDSSNDYEEDFAYKFNNLKIKKYNNFSVNTFSNKNETTLCLGKIQYPLNRYSLLNTKFKFDERYPIAVNFEIGDLEVTPNREQILYTRDNIKKIEEKLDLVQEEIEEIIESYATQDYTDLDVYIKQLKEPSISIPLLEDDSLLVSEGVYLKLKRKGSKITYKGEILDNNITYLYDFIYNDIYIPASFSSFRVVDGRLESKNLTWAIYNVSKAIRDINYNSYVPNYEIGKLFIGELPALNSASKDYIRKYVLDNTYFLKPVRPVTIIKFILKELKREVTKNSMYSKVKWNSHYIRLILSEVFPELSKIRKFTNASVPSSFIKDREAELKAKRINNQTGSIKWNEEINLFRLKQSENRQYGKIAVTTYSERINYTEIKTRWNKFPVIYSVKDDKFLRELYYIFSNIPNTEFQKYRFVEIAPTKINILRNFSNFIRIEDFMNVKYKKIRQLATARYINENYPYIKELKNIGGNLQLISDKLYTTVTQINDYVSRNNKAYYCDMEILEEIDKLSKDAGYYDEEMMGYLRENLKMLENARFLTLITSSTGRMEEKSINFAVDYILTKKLFRPDLKAVKKLREETIFNIKKEKDENN